MDSDSEIAKFKHLVTAIGVFCIALYFSFSEMNYLFRSVIVDATIGNVSETTITRGRKFNRRQVPALKVEYTYTNTDRKAVRDSFTVEMDSEIPRGNVRVQYISGKEFSSRLYTGFHWYGPLVLLGGIIWVGFAAYQIIQDHDQPFDTSQRNRHRKL